MGRGLAFLKKELLELLPPALFFGVVFHIVIFARSLMGAGPGFYLTTSATAIVGALIVGKAVLIVDALPVAQPFRDGRRAGNVAWRTLLYLSVVLVFQVLEELVPLTSERGGVRAALASMSGEVDWGAFWGTHVVLAVFLFFFTLLTEMIQVIGRDRFLVVFFGRRADPQRDAGPGGSP